MTEDINEYFTADDPNYAERLNNPNILFDIFTIKPRITLPAAFKTGKYPANENKYKAYFSIVQVINNTCLNTEDGFTAGANNQSFTLRVYPNFSSFKWWNSITWAGTGTIACQMKDTATGTVLISSVASGANLNSYNIGNKQVDLVFTLQNGARVTNITFEYQNDPKLSDTEWSIPQDNITGLNGALDDKADKSTVDALFDLIYPVGIIHEFGVDVDPNTITGWKGTWTQIKDKFTLAAGDNYDIGDMGGSETHVLTVDELASHKHDVSVPSSGQSTTPSGGGGATDSQGAHTHSIDVRSIASVSGTHAIIDGGGSSIGGTNSAGAHAHNTPNHTHTVPNHAHSVSESNKGSGVAHNNMPPYVVVSKWKRTA
jgi:hypothetical protein